MLQRKIAGALDIADRDVCAGSRDNLRLLIDRIARRQSEISRTQSETIELDDKITAQELKIRNLEFSNAMGNTRLRHPATATLGIVTHVAVRQEKDKLRHLKSERSHLKIILQGLTDELKDRFSDRNRTEKELIDRNCR